MQKQECINSIWWYQLFVDENRRMWSFHSLSFPSSHSHSHPRETSLAIPMGIPNIDTDSVSETVITVSILHRYVMNCNVLRHRLHCSVASCVRWTCRVI